VFLLCKEFVEVFVGIYILVFCRWVELWNIKNCSWFNSIVLELDLWLIALSSWLVCLLLHKIVAFVLLSFAWPSDDVIFYVLKFCNSLESWIPRGPGPQNYYYYYYSFHYFSLLVPSLPLLILSPSEQELVLLLMEWEELKSSSAWRKKKRKKGGEVGKACDKKMKFTITTCQRGKKEKKRKKGGRGKDVVTTCCYCCKSYSPQMWAHGGHHRELQLGQRSSQADITWGATLFHLIKASPKIKGG